MTPRLVIGGEQEQINLIRTIHDVTLNFFVEVEVQSGGSDCGLFSLAFAASLCAGEDPSQTSYSQHKFCHHLLVGCLEKEHHTFP